MQTGYNFNKFQIQNVDFQRYFRAATVAADVSAADGGKSSLANNNLRTELADHLAEILKTPAANKPLDAFRRPVGARRRRMPRKLDVAGRDPERCSAQVYFGPAAAALRPTPFHLAARAAALQGGDFARIRLCGLRFVSGNFARRVSALR